MRRLVRALVALLALLALLAPPRPALAHVGSPDVFFEGDAGPHRIFVAVRLPQVIPGVATIELRSPSDLERVTVVPMTLTGPGSEHPPTPDVAERSAADPHLFTASLWLMERGSLQVRVTASGPAGSGMLAVPVPASAQRLLPMSAGLGALLFGLMMLLAVGLVGIAGGVAREVTLEPGAEPDARRKKRAVVTMILTALAVFGVLAFGDAWWSSEAEAEANLIVKPWRIQPRVEGCRLTVPRLSSSQFRSTLLPDHGHEMHLFLVRTPGFDRLAHLHPVRSADDDFVAELPSLPAGHYRVFADIVVSSGYPVTGTAEVELTDVTCPGLAGDDSAWAGSGVVASADLEDGARMVFDRGPVTADVAMPLRFRVVDGEGRPAADLEPYMGMAGHAAIVKRDFSVFAHIHPNGTVAMPALELANGGPPVHCAHHETVAPDVAFPYGFPAAGDYTIFVQVKRAGRVQTGAFEVHVDPPDPREARAGLNARLR